MLQMQAVTEITAPVEAARWPVAPVLTPTWLALNDDCTAEQVGLVVAHLVAYQGHDLRGVTLPEAIDLLIAADELATPGGLLLKDSARAVQVSPGCCAGLEDWRQWVDLLDGRQPWLGHSPSAGVELFTDYFRVWQDAEAAAVDPASSSFLDVPAHLLLPLLEEVRMDLIAFLDVVGAWGAHRRLGRRGAALVEALDASWSITAPLPSAAAP
ncbi:hypothetical protein [Kineococcus xinjiangensis]|uniref:hypothetical protein n=1 Tax=Kineococcus xinjiangensis TaxID=512762 RepID=UPI0011B0EBDC|nr:hypothetical protein [Kineococcus xinjiangensis]